MSELKRCPFCGGEAKCCSPGNPFEVAYYWIYCKECGTKHRASINLESVINAWNDRKPINDVVKHLDKQKTIEMKVYGGKVDSKLFTLAYCEGINDAINVIKTELGG